MQETYVCSDGFVRASCGDVGIRLNPQTHVRTRTPEPVEGKADSDLRREDLSKPISGFRVQGWWLGLDALSFQHKSL